MFDLINRGNLPSAVQDEFEHLIAQIRGVFLKEHNEDGTHFVQAQGFDFVPAGAIMAWPATTPPTGWVLCNGQQLSRVTYNTLFRAIGTTYGSGNGSTTFNVPDLRGRFPLGKADSGLAGALANDGGVLDHTHNVSAHNHAISGDGAHDHGGATGSGGAHDHGGATASAGSHSHLFSGTTASATGGLGVAGGVLNTDPAFHTHAYMGMTDADGAHSHTISLHAGHTHTIASGGSHDHGGTTSSGGSGTTDAANPPYLVLNYIIATGRP